MAVKRARYITRSENGVAQRSLGLMGKTENIVFVGLLVVVPLVMSNWTIDPALLPRTLSLQFLLLIGLPVAWVRSKQWRMEILYNEVTFVYIIFILFGLLSLIWATNPIEGFYDWIRYFSIFLFFGFILLSFRSMTQDFILKTLVISGALLANIGLIQSFGWGFSWIPGSTRTPYATMINQNLFAEVILVLFPFSAVSIFILKSWWRYISLSATLAIFTAILLSSTRSAWVGFAVALTATGTTVVFLVSKHRLFIDLKSRRIRIAIGGLLLIASAILCIANVYFIRVIDQSIWSMMKSARNEKVRINLWQSTLEMVKAAPVIGVGLGNWKIELPRYDRYYNYGYRVMRRPHNDFLWILAEVGIIGFLIYLTLIASQFRNLIQSLFSKDISRQRLIFLLGVLFAITAYLVDSMFSFPRERVYVSMLFAMCLALGAHMVKSRSVKPHSAKVNQILKDKVAPIATYALLVVVFAATIQRAYADTYGKATIYHRAQRDWEMAIAASTKAIEHWMLMDETNIPMHWYRGVAHFERGETGPARNDFEKAYRYNPNNIHVLNNLATSYEMEGRHEEAIEFYQRVLEIAPRFINAKVNLGAAYYNKGNFMEAERIFTECLQQRPTGLVKSYLAEVRKMTASQEEEHP